MPNTTINSKGYKEIKFHNHIVLKSYETIIAILNLKTNKLEETTEWYSQSTNRHLKLFKSRFHWNYAEQHAQDYIDNEYHKLEQDYVPMA